MPTCTFLLGFCLVFAQLRAEEIHHPSLDLFTMAAKLAKEVDRPTTGYVISNSRSLQKLAEDWQLGTKKEPLSQYLEKHDAGLSKLSAGWKHSPSDAALGSLIALSGMWSLLASESAGLLSEAAMLETFSAHRAAFEKLRDMMQEDKPKGLLSVRIDRTDPDNAEAIGISPRRLESYRKLMGEIPIKAIFLQGYPAFGENHQYFISVTGTLKIQSDSQFLVSSIDAALSKKRAEEDAYDKKHHKRLFDHFTLYRRVDDHWYLEYEQ